MGLTGPYRFVNNAEAVLWLTLGVGVLLGALLRPPATARRWRLALAVTLLLFGLSDVVETRTGAWWRPWWMLLWKGGCLLAFVSLYARRPRPGD